MCLVRETGTAGCCTVRRHAPAWYYYASAARACKCKGRQSGSIRAVARSYVGFRPRPIMVPCPHVVRPVRRCGWLMVVMIGTSKCMQPQRHKLYNATLNATGYRMPMLPAAVSLFLGPPSATTADARCRLTALYGVLRRTSGESEWARRGRGMRTALHIPICAPLPDTFSSMRA